MNFLRTLFWVILAVVAAIFTLRNWSLVAVNLWAGYTADVKLPVLMALSGLLAFIPTYAFHRTRVWRLNRRIDSLERNALLAAPPTGAAEPADAGPGAQP